MKVVIQRCDSASVSVGGKTVGQIDKGFMVLLGVGQEDTKADCERLAAKMIGLRIFSDDNGKINLSLKDVGGSLLVISQFTLYADTRKGHRPNFLQAKEPAEAERLYEYFVEVCRRSVPNVQTGEFGAEMKVSLVNDGPFTIILE
ncbi:MAG: D-aminoacyl-tRNA deacylase [Oscillospiraceae bacterium]|nr:D-aminoacyl-tRNA deacylase [Oscillospiraceae bacterium]